jgi:hypothetical protein
VGTPAATCSAKLPFEGSPIFDRQRNQADKVGQQPKDEMNENDHAAITP